MFRRLCILLILCVLAQGWFVAGTGVIDGTGDLFFADFEATGCLNEANGKIASAGANADCDDTTAPLNGVQSLYAAGGSAEVVTVDLSHGDRTCWEYNIRRESGGSDLSSFLSGRNSSGIVNGPNVRYRLGNLLDLECYTGESASPSTTTALPLSSYRKLYVDFSDSSAAGCLLVEDPTYQNSESVCCDATTPPDWVSLRFGDVGFGFTPDHRADDVRVYDGPCRVGPLFEETSDDNSGGVKKTTFPLLAPANREVGDLLIAFVGQESSNDCDLSAPAGWTQIGSDSNGVGLRGSTAVFYNVLDASEVSTSSWTFTGSCTQEWVGAMYRVAARTYDDTSAGSWLVTPPNGFVETGQGTSFECQAVPGLDPRSWVARVAFWETGNDSAVTATWSSGTEDFENASTGGGAANIMLHGVVQEESSGTVNSNITDPTGATSYDYHCWTIPIKPAA